MYYRKEYLKRAHREIDTIFRVLFPEHGMAVREAIFKNRHPVAMDRKLENSVIELKIELLKAKAENEKLAEQNQELKRKNELLQQELEKLNKRVSRKEISVLKKL